MSELEFRVLGEFECRLDGELLDIGGQRPRMLLGALVAATAGGLSTDQLIAEVWSDAEMPEHPRRALQTLLSRIRTVLRLAPGDDRLEKRNNGYRLVLYPGELDSERFSRLIEKAAAASATAGVELLEEALGLWRGDPYGEFGDTDFGRVQSGRLHELRLVAIERLGRVLLDVGDPDGAVRVVEPLVVEQPLREGHTAVMMRALYAQGRHVEALEHFQAYRQRLAAELGLEPSPALRQLEADILDHRLDDPAPVVAVASSQLAVVESGGLATMTLLVAEIENSEELWEQHLDDVHTIIGRHIVILREEIEAGNGEIWVSGSGRLSSAFATATAAAAALKAMEALEAEPWPDGVEPRARFALHTGSAAPSDLVHGRTARHAEQLVAAAHPGQVLVSAAGAALLRAEFGPRLTDLGRHQLIGLATPEQVFQLNPLKTGDDFPPIRAATDVPGNLPAAVDELVGRSELVSYVEALASTARLVTLTGAAGLGKSRLGVEVARRLAPGFVDGVWLCELASVSDETSAIDALARAVGADQGSGGDALGRLAESIGAAHLLLVLDNCEHLVDFAATATTRLLERCPNIYVLATSREVLAIAGEHVVGVPP